MPYTILCRGHVLGTTDLDLYPLVSGQHSGWLHAAPGAQCLLDAIAIGYPSMLSWLLRATVPPNGVALASSTFLASGECQAITEAMAARLQFVVSLHRDDGTEVATTDIVLQDRHYMPFQASEAEEPAGLSPRYQVHLRLVNADDSVCPSPLSHPPETGTHRS